MAKNTHTFFCWGVSHHTAPLKYREQIIPGPEQLDQLYKALGAEEWLNEFIVLSTCNRLELYGVTDQTGSQELVNCISHVLKADTNKLNIKSTMLLNEEAIKHLFSVTAGLDSQIVGEVEITGQIKKAYLHATRKRTVGKVLHKIFQKSFQTTKWIRSNTSIGKGHINVTTVAVDLALKVFGHLRNSTAMVIGAGDIAEKTISALQSRGIQKLIICNRTFEKAEALASAANGEAIPFESLGGLLNKTDVVLSSTSSPDLILTEPRMNMILKRRPTRPLCLLDLALPRDIDPHINKFPNVFLYNLDDLAEIAEANLRTREKELDKCQNHISRKIHYLTLHRIYKFASAPKPENAQ